MKRKYEIVGRIYEIENSLLRRKYIGAHFKNKKLEGFISIHLDKSYINFSISEYKKKILNGIFEVKNIEYTTTKNEIGKDLISIKAKSDKVSRSFLSNPISRLIVYSSIYVDEGLNGETVHKNHFEELFPYLSIADEISERFNYESKEQPEKKYSLFYSKEDFLARIMSYFFSHKNWYFEGKGFLVRKIGEDIEFRGTEL